MEMLSVYSILTRSVISKSETAYIQFIVDDKGCLIRGYQCGQR